MGEISDKVKKGLKLIKERFVWEYKTSKALNRITFTFHQFDQTLHFNCSWILPQWSLIYLRLFMLIYLIGMVGWDISNYYNLGYALYWGVYVTNWTYAITIIYYFFATTSTIYSYANNSIGKKKYIKSIEMGKIPNRLKTTKSHNNNKHFDVNINNQLNKPHVNIVVSDGEMNGYNKNIKNDKFSEIQMIDIDLDKQNNKESSYGHASVVSLSTTHESPINNHHNQNHNNLNHNHNHHNLNQNHQNTNIQNEQIKYVKPPKTRNIFKRYIRHLKSHSFIIKYSEETDRPYFVNEIDQKMDNSTTNLNLPLLIRLMWLFHAIALPASYIVATVYWTMSIISPVGIDGFTFLTFNKHGLTAIALSIDTYITTIPFFISHAFYSFFYCLIYLIFTIVYYILKLPNPQSKDDLGFIYSAINFADPAVSVPCSIGIFLFLLLAANIIWFFVGFSRNHIIDPLPTEDSSDKRIRVNYYV